MFYWVIRIVMVCVRKTWIIEKVFLENYHGKKLIIGYSATVDVSADKNKHMIFIFINNKLHWIKIEMSEMVNSENNWRRFNFKLHEEFSEKMYLRVWSSENRIIHFYFCLSLVCCNNWTNLTVFFLLVRSSDESVYCNWMNWHKNNFNFSCYLYRDKAQEII